MESFLLAIDPRDPLWIAIAFLFGFAVKMFGLPPLVGFLLAGFVLNASGAEGGEFLAATADLGITLLLFTIGLKLQLRSLAAPQVWGVATLHMGLVTAMICGLLLLLGTLGLPLLAGLDFGTALLIGFALSFSSTVFAVKILDQLGATSTRHGTLSIGVLIIQDIAAVAFLAASTGKLPSAWAIALLALIPLRHVLGRVLTLSGHGELLILFGIVLALGGADLFELAGMKGDLGALAIGMLLANHPKANELAKALLGFKDLFLIGFFLSVGMTVLPSWSEILIALLLIVILPLKVAIYFGLFAAFRLRTGTAWRASLNLANYSEFGLIVGTIAAASGWLPEQWLAVFAIALSLSFIGVAPLMDIRDRIYGRWRHQFRRLQRATRLPGEENISFGTARIVIFGMGRIGTSVYDALEREQADRLVGVDINEHTLAKHRAAGRQVIFGDPTNPDFWSRVEDASHLEWVLFAMPSHPSNLLAVEQLRDCGYRGRIAATSWYPEEAEELEKAGVEFAFNIYQEAGEGLASDLRRRVADSD
jgi:predicted Kef-type K+ transport protein